MLERLHFKNLNICEPVLVGEIYSGRCMTNVLSRTSLMIWEQEEGAVKNTYKKNNDGQIFY